MNTRRIPQLVLLTTMLLMALAALPSAASATTYAVTIGIDFAGVVDGVCNSGPGATCPFREAVREANAHPGPDIIDITGVSVELQLVGAGEDAAMTGDIDVLDDLTVRGLIFCGSGPFSHPTVLSGPSLGDRLFEIPNGSTASLWITCIQVEEGHAAAGDAGCIRAGTTAGAVVLDNVSLRNCSSATVNAVGSLVVESASMLTLQSSAISAGAVHAAGSSAMTPELRAQNAHIAGTIFGWGSNGAPVEGPGSTGVMLEVHDGSLDMQSSYLRGSARGVRVLDSNVAIDNATFNAHRSGAALTINNDTSGTVSVTNSFFGGNTGGALVVTALSRASADITMSDLVIDGTTALMDGAPEAVLFVDVDGTPASVDITDVSLSGNGGGFVVGMTDPGADVHVARIESHGNHPDRDNRCTISICVLNASGGATSGRGGDVTVEDVSISNDGAGAGLSIDGTDVALRDISVAGESNINPGTISGSGTGDVRLDRVRSTRTQLYIQGDNSSTGARLQVSDIVGALNGAIWINCGGTIERSTIIRVDDAIRSGGCSTTKITHSIIGASGAACDAAFASGGFNLFIDSHAGCTVAPGDVTGANVQFDNIFAGGVPALRPRSGDAIDLIPVSDPACGIDTDVMERAVPIGGGCDAGASEGEAAARADLRVALTTGVTTLVAGATTNAQLTLHNAGPDLARGAFVDVALPAALSGGTLPGGCATISGGVRCTAGTLAVGTQRSWTVPVVAGTAGGAHAISATASATTANADPIGDSATVSITIPGAAPGVEPPRLELDPVITGEAIVGAGVGCLAGTWSGAASYEITWLSGATPIPGATSPTLKLTRGMLGTSVTCQVTARNAGGATVAVTEAIGPISLRRSTVVTKCTITGTAGRDVLRGTAKADVICGAGGNDRLLGLGGNDVLIGGAEVDVLVGGAGNDLLDGGVGNDQLLGGAGGDTIRGGAGNDVVRGEAGSDALTGGPGDDTIRGGAGGDLINAGQGRDTAIGDANNDVIFGGAAADLLEGGDGFDLLTGNEGPDELRGQIGDDTLWGGDGNDLLDGGDGGDQLYGMGGNDTYTSDAFDTINPGAGT